MKDKSRIVSQPRLENFTAPNMPKRKRTSIWKDMISGKSNHGSSSQEVD